jgi:hypothetical protein
MFPPDYHSKLDPPGTEITRYIRTWKEYRKRCRVTFGLMALFPLVIVGAIALDASGRGAVSAAGLFFGWGAAVGLADLWRQSIRCPRCGERFFRRSGSVTGGKCRHCHLPKCATYNVPRGIG